MYSVRIYLKKFSKKFQISVDLHYDIYLDNLIIYFNSIVILDFITKNRLNKTKKNWNNQRTNKQINKYGIEIK